MNSRANNKHATGTTRKEQKQNRRVLTDRAGYQPKRYIPEFMQLPLQNWNDLDIQQQRRYLFYLSMAVLGTGISIYYAPTIFFYFASQFSAETNITNSSDIILTQKPFRNVSHNNITNNTNNQTANISTKNIYNASVHNNTFFNKTTSIPEQDLLKKLIKKVRINCPEHYLQAIPKEWHSLIKNFGMQIREILSDALPEQDLIKILSQDDFAIELAPAPEGKYNNLDATYLPETRHIRITIDTDLSKKYLLQILRNEFHHAWIHYINQQQIPGIVSTKKHKLLPLYPFLNEHGKVDLTLYKRHLETIVSGVQRVNEFSLLLKSKETGLTKEQKSQLEYYLNAMKYYQPHECREILKGQAARDFLDMLVPHKDKIHKIKNVPDNTNLFYHRIVHRDDTFSVFYTYASGNSPREKGLAFVRYFEIEINNIMRGNYAKLSDQVKDMEISSSLQEYDEKLLSIFFPEWQKYFTEYAKTLQSSLKLTRK